MNASLGWWLVVAGMLFWLVGLHNRIARQRARAVEVLAVLDKQVRACAALILAHHAELQAEGELHCSLFDSEEHWSHAVKAAQSVETVWGETRRNTLQPSAQRLRSESWQALRTAWSHLLARPVDLAGAPVPDDLKLAWESSASKAVAVQSALNIIIDTYNGWIKEFPARLVTRWMGFEVSASI